MIALLVTVFLVLLISALCSMIEAALYAAPWTAIERMRKQGSKSGQLLYELRANIDRPITAILTLNTVANTAGAATAGAIAAAVLGDGALPWFAALLTLVILCFGEILPKTLGVTYATPLAAFFSRPLSMLIVVLKPVIWLIGRLIRLLTPERDNNPQATEDDIRAIASISRQSGRIQPYEEQTIRNILALDQRRVHDIMTPRTVVFSLPATMTVAEAYADPQIWQFSRIPVYGEHNEDIIGIVERRRIGQTSAFGSKGKPISEIMRPARLVPESLTLDKLLKEFLDARQHLFIVLDEYGGLAGVVSLEDVLEEMLGREIIDESDAVPDMQELARQSAKHTADSPAP